MAKSTNLDKWRAEPEKARREVQQSQLTRSLTEMERQGGYRDPAGHYIVLALTHNVFHDWLRKWGVDPKQVRYINDPSDVRGVGYDLIVVCFPSWGEREDTRFRDATRLIQDRAIAYRYADRERPFVENGRILGWIRRKDG